MNGLKSLHTLRQLLVGMLAGLLVALVCWLISLGFLKNFDFLGGINFRDSVVGFLAVAGVLVLVFVLSLVAQTGAGLRTMLHVIFPQATGRVVGQTIADMLCEREIALSHQQKWLAHWILIRFIYTVIFILLIQAASAALGSIFKLLR